MLMILRRINRAALLAVVCMSVIVGCSKRKPAGVLPPEKLETVLYDYHLAQVMVNGLPSSERFKKDLYFDYIYDKHGVTAAEIDSSLVYYARYPEDLATMYERLAMRVERDIQRIDDESSTEPLHKSAPVVGDSADLWFDTPLVQLFNTSLLNRFSTTVPYDTNFKSNDTFEWNGEVLFLRPEVDSLSRYLQLAMTIEFSNDSLTSSDTLLYTSGRFSLTLADTADVKLRNVRCNAYYKGKEEDCGLLLYNMELMRYHQVLVPDSVASDSLLLATDSVKASAVPAASPAMKRAAKRK